MKTLRLAVLLATFALFSLLALLTPDTDRFRSYSAPAPPVVAESIHYPVAVADGIKFRVIYPDQNGMASVAADIGALAPLEVWFGVDVGLGWDGVQMHYDAASHEWVGELARSHKPNVRTTGRLGLVYSPSPDDTVYYDLPFSTEIGIFTALLTPYVMPGDLLQIYMAITTTEGMRWQYGADGYLPLLVYVDDDVNPEDNLLDRGDDGDLRAGDGMFTGWTPVTWSGVQQMSFSIWQWPVAQIPFTVTTEPELIVLSYLLALHAEFLVTGTLGE